LGKGRKNTTKTQWESDTPTTKEQKKKAKGGEDGGGKGEKARKEGKAILGVIN